MKIVTWNCNGAFRKKYPAMEKLRADVYVIQECEDPEQVKGDLRSWAGSYLWHGQNKHKGLCVFSRSELGLQRLDWSDNGLQSFLPVRINNQFNLVAVWTKQTDSRAFRYIGQLWKYLQLHKEQMAASPTVLCGDLNSNTIWDVAHREWNHSEVVRELSIANIHSLYHLATGEEHGSESVPTFYLQRNPKKPYHIDFAFVSQSLFNPRIDTVVVGKRKRWLELSDHAPVEFTLSL